MEFSFTLILSCRQKSKGPLTSRVAPVNGSDDVHFPFCRSAPYGFGALHSILELLEQYLRYES